MHRYGWVLGKGLDLTKEATHGVESFIHEYEGGYGPDLTDSWKATPTSTSNAGHYRRRVYGQSNVENVPRLRRHVTAKLPTTLQPYGSTS